MSDGPCTYPPLKCSRGCLERTLQPSNSAWLQAHQTRTTGTECASKVATLIRRAHPSNGSRNTRLALATVLANGETATNPEFLELCQWPHGAWHCRVAWHALTPGSRDLCSEKLRLSCYPCTSPRNNSLLEFGPDKNFTSQVRAIWFGVSFKNRRVLKVYVKTRSQRSDHQRDF